MSVDTEYIDNIKEILFPIERTFEVLSHQEKTERENVICFSLLLSLLLDVNGSLPRGLTSILKQELSTTITSKLCEPHKP